METKTFISSLTDRKKAMKWLRENAGWTLEQVKRLASSPLPFPYKSESLDVKWYLTYAREWGLEEIEAVSREGTLVKHAGCDPIAIPDPAECGFETSWVTAISAGERAMFMEKIGELREIKEAWAWLAAQPADVKRKIELLRPRGPMG